MLAPDIDDEDQDEEHHHKHSSGLQDSVRPPVYRDDLLAQQEEGGVIAGGIELSDRSTSVKGRKNEKAPDASLDLLDLQVEAPSTYNQLPPEAEQSV